MYSSGPVNNQNDFMISFTDSEKKMFDINEEMRLGFIRKVYGILTSQLLVTVILTIISMISDSFRKFQLHHTGLLIFILILTLILPCVIICFNETMRKVPNNYIILFGFTFAESYLVSFICAFSQPQIVFMAAFMTLALVISLTIYAVTTKEDITMQGGLIFIIACAVCMFSIFLFFTSNRFVHIILCVGGIILFGLYLIYDTQLILGTKSHMIETEDYILASFMLYTDIIYLFLKILELIQLLTHN